MHTNVNIYIYVKMKDLNPFWAFIENRGNQSQQRQLHQFLQLLLLQHHLAHLAHTHRTGRHRIRRPSQTIASSQKHNSSYRWACRSHISRTPTTYTALHTYINIHMYIHTYMYVCIYIYIYDNKQWKSNFTSMPTMWVKDATILTTMLLLWMSAMLKSRL